MHWLLGVVKGGSVTARDMSQGLGKLGFAATALDWERPCLGPLYAWSPAIQGKTGPLKLPVMLKLLLSWLADRLEGGDRLQKPDVGVQGAIPLIFYTDVKAEDGKAWIGGFLEVCPGCQGPWFSLEVEKDWAVWVFLKGDTKKVIAAFELLATLIGVRLWVPDGKTKQTTRVAIKGYTDGRSHEREV